LRRDAAVGGASWLPKTEIAIEWQAEKDLVGRAERGYNGCATKHNHEPTR